MRFLSGFLFTIFLVICAGNSQADPFNRLLAVISSSGPSGITVFAPMGDVESTAAFDLDVTKIASYFESTIDNAAAVDKGGGLVGIPITAHAFVAGQAIAIDGTTNYEGAQVIVSQTTNEIVITDTFVSETFGGTETAKSQEFFSLETTPSGGGTQANYTWALGADVNPSTDDPLLVGTVGTDTAHFLMDGTDFFTLKSATSTAMLNKMHRTDQSGSWIAMTLQTPSSGGIQGAFGNRNAGTDRGINLNFDNLRQIDALVSNGTSAVFMIQNGDTKTDDNPTLISLSWDGVATTNNVRNWLNTGSAATVNSSTFNASTTDSTNIFNFGSIESGSNILDNGSRVYAISGGDGFLTDTTQSAIRDQYQIRHEAGRY